MIPHLLFAALTTGTFTTDRNPVFTAADPHAAFVGNRLWVFPTHHPPGDPGFSAFSTLDLRTWESHGVVLRMKDIKWIGDDGAANHYPWAPAFAERNGKYYLYFSIGPQNPTPSRIGVAVADRPEGPYRDSGKPLVTGGNGFEAIDAMAFEDPKTGRWYLYAGGSAGAKLRVWELTDDMIGLKREIPVETPKYFTEGAFMHYLNGTYYLSYSHGGWRDSSYSGHYATSGSPTGPWRYGGAFLTSDESRKGPGHHSFFNVPGTDRWFVVYHRWENQTGNGPYNGQRQTAIDRVYFEPGAIIRPVKMSSALPELHPKN